MKFLLSVICVVGALIFVESKQMSGKFTEAFCKIQCFDEMAALCFPREDCECSHKLIPDLDSINMTEYGKAGLKLKCKTEDTFLVEWSNVFNPFNRSSNTVYFLHIKSSNKESFSDVIFCHYYSVERLNANTSYSITLFGVDADYNIFASKPLNVITNERNKTPQPISSISVDLKHNMMKYEADVKWIPASDFSCYYEIVLFCTKASHPHSIIPAPETYDIIPSPELFELHIEELLLGYTYDLTIRARGTEWENESESRSYTIHVPTCIETHMNLTICEPPQPKNLTIMETPSSDLDEIGSKVYDIHINWLRPILIPDCYIAKLNIFDMNRQVTGTPNLTIPGESNNATFEKINLSSYYQVHLQAISSGGRSIPAIVNRLSIPPTGTSPSQHEKISSLQTILIIIGILGFLLIFGLLTIPIRQRGLILFNSKRENNYEENSNIKQVQYTNQNQIVKETDEWEINIESMSFQSILGEGAFGVVWHALIGQTPVACKTLKDNSTADEIRQLQQEIEIMKYVGTHPNIVSMVGCITENVPNGPILIVEYCSMGDLLTYLRTIYKHISNQLNQFQGEDYHDQLRNEFTNKSYELMNQSEAVLCLTYKDVLSFGRQIALGMEYLSNQRVLHRDLAARNILICDNKRLKVSDFGLSRDVYMNSVYRKTTGGKLPIRWMALESLTHQIYTTQSDVWSFGVVLWEIVSFGAIPYPGVESQELLGILKRGDRMTKPQCCTDEVYSIMSDCWKESPNDRPTFSCLKEAFDSLLTNDTNYLELSANQ